MEKIIDPGQRKRKLYGSLESCMSFNFPLSTAIFFLLMFFIDLFDHLHSDFSRYVFLNLFLFVCIWGICAHVVCWFPQKTEEGVSGCESSPDTGERN